MNCCKVALLILTFSPLKINCRIITQLIDDLTNQYDVAPNLYFYSCNKSESFHFVKYFANRLISLKITHPETEGFKYPIPPNRAFFILNLHCSEAENILQEANKAMFFATPFKWIVYSSETLAAIDIAQQYFAQLDIFVDSDVTLAVLSRHEPETYSVKKIYKICKKSSFILEEFGEWTGQPFYSTKLMENSYRRRRDLRQTILNTCIVITHNDSLNHLTDKRDIHIDSIAKVNYVLVQHLADFINATLSYSIQDTWGYKNPQTGEWSGMIGELTRKEADIGGTALFLTLDRIDIIDYIAMTTPTRSKFIFREPKLSYVVNVFTLPFDIFVWISIIALMAIMTVALYIAVDWEWKKRKFLNRGAQSSHSEIHKSWSEVCLVTVAALCQQGSSSTPISTPGRITVIFLVISFMFLYTSYSANIVALLQSSSNSIRELKDILHSRLEVGVDDTVFNHFYFPNATEPIRRAIYHQKVAPSGQKPKFYTLEEGIQRMRNGLFAFHVETGPGYKYVGEIFQEHEKCGLQEIQFLEVSDPWLAIQKNSSFKEMLKVGLRLLQENGIQKREVGLIYTRKPQCLTRGSSFISVGLVDCYPAAVVLVGGIASALSVLIVEIFINTKLKKLKITF